MASDRVFDELICFLGDALFQVPVRTFLDENCLIFDPTISPLEDHKKVHENYKRLVDALLDGFCEDSKLTVEKAVKGIKSMSEVPDLQEYFQGIFEQVLSTIDFDMFYRLMCKRNIIIQEQVLKLLITTLGSTPESLAQGEHSSQSPSGRGAAGDSVMMKDQEKEDEEVLRKAMEESKKEEERKLAKKAAEEKDLQKTLVLSQQEAKILSSDKKIIDEDMKRLALDDSKPTPKQPGQSSGPFASSAQSTPPIARPSIVTNMHTQGSSSQAANEWLKSAQSEVHHQSPAEKAALAQMSKLSPDELQKRQQYLKEQRDKLMALKKEQREKQLLTAEKANPKRPGSARVARAAMNNSTVSSQQSEEDAKKIAMRKAIADKLKMEVIGK